MLHRVLTLYDWQENFNFPAHPEFVVALVNDAGMRPTKASFFVPVPGKKDSKERRRTLYKNTRLMDLVSEFRLYQGFELCVPINRNFLNLESDMSLDISPGRSITYQISKAPDALPLPDVIRHIRLFCTKASPRYGFSRVSEGPEAASFAKGIGGMGRPREENFRADALGSSLIWTKQHLAGRFLDVYELNVLSPVHMKAKVQGQSLGDWIRSGQHGELVEINDSVTLWLVPEKLRDPIRARLWREGLFIDDSMPEIWTLDISHIRPA
ncbi:MAG: hypothetical protein FJX63_09610 [Alphaproteobacteria bacterium]|nr:hypothetical protein [Alphaproteobacteria bacterium]